MSDFPITETTNTTLIYGRHPIADALAAGTEIEKILLQQGTRGETEIELRKLSKEYGVPLVMVPKEKLNRLAKDGNHQGVVAYVSAVVYHKLEDVLPSIIAREENPLFVILDSVTDVRNFGAIARSAEVAGCHAIIVPQKGSAAINAEAMKASAGALSQIIVCREKTLSAVMDYFGNEGIQVFASDLKATKTLAECDFSGATALLIGSEETGVSRNLLQRADDRFIIPQYGKTDSFNVSVATGIMLYEVNRQRNKTI